MISRGKYLQALETVKKYRKQQMKSVVKNFEPDKPLSEYSIPRRIQKKLGEIYLWNLKDRAFRENDWESCYQMIKVSDLGTENFRLKMLRNWSGIGIKMIKEIEKIYADLGVK